MAQALAAAELATYDEVKGQLKSKVGMTDGLPLTLCTAFASGYVSTVRDGYAAVTYLYTRLHGGIVTLAGTQASRLHGQWAHLSSPLWLLSGCSLAALSGCSLAARDFASIRFSASFLAVSRLLPFHGSVRHVCVVGWLRDVSRGYVTCRALAQRAHDCPRRAGGELAFRRRQVARHGSAAQPGWHGQKVRRVVARAA